MKCWDEDSYYIPALHTKPLGDKDPRCAPLLNPLREELQRIARRPVNFQATSNIILFARDVLLGQPYFTIIEPEETDKAEETEATAATAGASDSKDSARVPDLGGAAGEGA